MLGFTGTSAASSPGGEVRGPDLAHSDSGPPMSTRLAVPTDLPAVAGVFRTARTVPARGVVASVLPAPYVTSAVSDRMSLVRATVGLHPRARLFVEHYGAVRAAALVYVSRRPEWVVLFLAARPDPGGGEGAFRLLGEIAAAAARAGAYRLYATVPDEPLGRETFFQAGFYSFTTETWFVARSSLASSPPRSLRPVTTRDAHDLFRLYARTTPHAVQRAQQLSTPDFDVRRGAAGLAPPHLVDGNPLAMRRGPTLVVGDERGIAGAFVCFHGRGAHPDICKAISAEGTVDVVRDLLRMGAGSLYGQRPVACPVRPYEEHIGRALEAEGFQPIGAAMLFVKELAVRVEEPAFAPAVVR
jgi:hypothetical protein